MRYILIDPSTKRITEGDHPGLADRKSRLDTIYEIMGCAPIDFQDMRISPKHDILLDDNAAFKKPQPPGFLIGNQHVISRAMILGVRGANHIAASLPLERVKAAVDFEVGPREFAPPSVVGFETAEEMQKFMAAQPKVRWL
jgi:hypothetical protein